MQSELVKERSEAKVPSAWLVSLGTGEKATAAFVFGCFFALSSPGFEQWWLAWVGMVPLLVLVRACSGWRQAALCGLTFGLGYNLVALSWFLGLYPLRWLGINDWLGVEITAALWFLASFHQALLFCFFALMIFCLPVRAGFLAYIERPYFPYLLSTPLIFIFLQWLLNMSEVFLAVPINQLAYSQHHSLELLQLVKYTGSGFIDFLIVLVNACLLQLILDFMPLAQALPDRIDKFSARVGAVIDLSMVLTLLIVCLFWGGRQMSELELRCYLDNPDSLQNGTPSAPIAIVQGNVTVEEDRLKTTPATDIAKRYSDLSTSLGVSLMVFPEAILNFSQNGPGLLFARLNDLCRAEKKEIVAGSIETLSGGRVNAARLLTYRPVTDTLYIKQRLVPFGEFAPLGRFGKNIADEIERYVPSAQERFFAAEKTHLLQSFWGKTGVAIGTEIVYPYLLANEVRRGATVLLNISNLGWFHNSSLNKQMLAAAVFRAVENGRYLVVASNTGISAIIDPSGMITSESLPGRRGILLNTVQFLYKQTPFTRMWWL